MNIGVLVDISNCIGCRSCQVACKSWNDNPGEVTDCWGSYENPPSLTADTWTKVRFAESEKEGRLQWSMFKIQCMHCLQPACAAVCPKAVHKKTEEGVVATDPEKCIACENCLKVCPFNVPRIKWTDDSAVAGLQAKPLMTKCLFCYDRILNGEKPACTKACPTGALKFGKRDELLVEARARIKKYPGKYVNHIYGEKEVGGTSWMYISSVPFKELGFPTVPEEALSLPEYTKYYPDLYPEIKPQYEPVSAINSGVSGVVMGILMGVAGAIAFRQLRSKKQDQEAENEESGK